MTRSHAMLCLLGFSSVSALGQIGCSDDVPGSSAGTGGTGGATFGVGPAGAGVSAPVGNGQAAGSVNPVVAEVASGGNSGAAALGGGGRGDGTSAAGSGASVSATGNGPGVSMAASGGSAGAAAENGASGGATASGASAGAVAGNGASGGATASGASAGAAATGGAGTSGGAGGHGAGGMAVGGAGGQGVIGAGGGTNVGPVALDPSLLSNCSGTNPIRCTIPVPANGNYNVSVELGSATAASNSRILAELARLETQPVALAAGEFSTQTFSVNVRTEVHDDYSAPGMILDLVIDGSAPALHGLGFAAAPSIPTLFVVGDSTSCDWDPVVVANAGRSLERGWAQEFSQYLLPGIAVADYADSGDTAGSLYGKFASRGAMMKGGDFLFIQFGHNDQKNQAAVDSFKANLMKFVDDARAAGATPILFTPVARKSATTANPGFNGLDAQVRELAASADIALVDLTALAIAYYDSLSSAERDALFFSASEGTHFSESGATQIAGLVAQELKSGTVSIRDFLN